FFRVEAQSSDPSRGAVDRNRAPPSYIRTQVNASCDHLLARRKSSKVAPRTRSGSNSSSRGNRDSSPSKDSIKAAEDLALTAFASGLKLAAAFGTVAAETTSLAVASITVGARTLS